MPPAAFLFSIAALSVTLAGFSGLVAAFRRGADWEAMDAYRLRQIPEMGLATALIALAIIPLADTVRSATATLQVAAGVALLFTMAHVIVLVTRSRRLGIVLTTPTWAVVSVIDIITVLAGTVCLALGSPTAFEWLMVAMLARPMIAFVLVLEEVASLR